MTSILIIGQGAIGTFLGVALRSENCSVDHYVRDVSVSVIKEIECAFTDRRKKPHRSQKGLKYTYAIKRSLQNLDGYDFIVIPVAHHQFRNVIDTLNQNSECLSTLVLMGNIWKDFKWFKSNIKGSYLYAFPNFGGVIKESKLHGWLTGSFTVGCDNEAFSAHTKDFGALLQNQGFHPRFESNMIGWLMTHFAYNAGMLLEAALNGGFRKMSKRLPSLRRMYSTITEGMEVVESLGIKPRDFAEGRRCLGSSTWNVFTTYLLFLLPGMARSADAGMNIKEWASYSAMIKSSAHELGLEVPLISSGLKKLSTR